MSSPSYYPKENTHTYTLDNGLKLILQSAHAIPNIAMSTFWRVGSRNERSGITGLSHFFEHMMFRGSKKYGPGEFDSIMEFHGGSNNAYTNQNVTVYQNWFPASSVETVFALEADRIANLSLAPDMIESEREIVLSERRATVESDHFELIEEKLWATAYQVHSYRWPVIGWMADIESWTVDDLKHFFRTYYSPDNAVMILVGDFEKDSIRELAKKYFEPIMSNGGIPAVDVKEPQQLGERRTELCRPANLPAVTCGFHVPASQHPHYYPLLIIETILTSGQSSRLYKRLLDREQMAVWVESDFGLTFDPSLFIFTIQMQDGKTTEEAEDCLYEELQRLIDVPVDDQELQKTKNICRAALFQDLKTIADKADALGTSELYFGDYNKLFGIVEQLEAVTPEEIQLVARLYFHSKNRTVVTFVPEK